MLTVLMTLLSVAALGVSLVNVCLPDYAHSPAYYDGDEDDVGIVQERQTLAFHVGILQPLALLAPPLLSRRDVLHRTDSSGDVLAPRGSDSRSPPA